MKNLYIFLIAGIVGMAMPFIFPQQTTLQNCFIALICGLLVGLIYAFKITSNRVNKIERFKPFNVEIEYITYKKPPLTPEQQKDLSFVREAIMGQAFISKTKAMEALDRIVGVNNG